MEKEEEQEEEVEYNDTVRFVSFIVMCNDTILKIFRLH
jgi:hypothetical protein